MNPSDKKKDLRYKILICSFAFFGIALRLLLCWANPPTNSFDSHYEPIFMTMEGGSLPAKDACWQCYQPPVFYYTSAMIGKFLMHRGLDGLSVVNVLHGLCCCYSIVSLGLLYLILRKVPLPDFCRLFAFAIACFLPRHIYMSAMHSNDTLTYACTALCIYLLMIAIEHRFAIKHLILLSIAVTVTLFTKYTAFVIIPMVLSTFFLAVIWKMFIPWKKALIAFILMIFVPLAFLGAYVSSNLKTYGKPLPWNDSILDTDAVQPHAENSVNFFNLKPWSYAKIPIVSPDKIDSFWTLIHSRMWFDVEPKFLYFTDNESVWWDQYYHWIKGKGPFPKDNPLSSFTCHIGFGLILLGLIPLTLLLIGLIRCVILCGGWIRSDHMKILKIQVFLVLLLFNTIGIILLTLKSPVYSSMKAAYFLNSLPAFSVMMGFGITVFQNRLIRRFLVCTLVFLFALVTIHIGSIVWALKFKTNNYYIIKSKLKTYQYAAHLDKDDSAYFDDIVGCYLQKIQIAPNDYRNYFTFAVFLEKRQLFKEAIDYYRQTLRLQTDFVPALVYLSRIQSTTQDNQLRNPVEAVQLAEKACELTSYKNLSALEALINAYANTGHVNNAEVTIQKAIELARKSNQTSVIEHFSKMRQSLQNDKAIFGEKHEF